MRPSSHICAFEAHVCATLAGIDSPWSTIAALYLGGVCPIGYVDDAFVLFAPT